MRKFICILEQLHTRDVKHFRSEPQNTTSACFRENEQREHWSRSCGTSLVPWSARTPGNEAIAGPVIPAPALLCIQHRMTKMVRKYLILRNMLFKRTRLQIALIEVSNQISTQINFM